MTLRFQAAVAMVALLGCSARPTFGDEDEDGAAPTSAPDGGDDGRPPGDGGDDDRPKPPPDDGDDEPDPGDDGDDGVFIDEGDHYGGLECDPWIEDCPNGEKCMPWASDGGSSWNAYKCSPIAPDPKQPGDSCMVQGNGVSGVDDCDIHSMCWNVDPQTNEGHCVPFCIGDPSSPSCTDPTAMCMISSGPLILCLPTCHPLLQDCSAGDVCVTTASGDAFVCVIDASGDMGAYGDPCEYVNVCDPRLFCANADIVPGCLGSIGCCSEYCDLELMDDAQCTGYADGQVCIPWWDDAYTVPPRYENVGACAIPPP